MIVHEIFRVVSRFPRYISCYIAENRFSLEQCAPDYCAWSADFLYLISFCLYFTSCFTSVPGQWSTVCLYLVSCLSVSGQLFGCTWSAVCMYLVSSLLGQLFVCTWSAFFLYVVCCLSVPGQLFVCTLSEFVCTRSAVCLYLVSCLSVPCQPFVCTWSAVCLTSPPGWLRCRGCWWIDWTPRRKYCF